MSCSQCKAAKRSTFAESILTGKSPAKLSPRLDDKSLESVQVVEVEQVEAEVDRYRLPEDEFGRGENAQ